MVCISADTFGGMASRGPKIKKNVLSKNSYPVKGRNTKTKCINNTLRVVSAEGFRILIDGLRAEIWAKMYFHDIQV